MEVGVRDEIGDGFVGGVLTGILVWWDGVEVLTGFSEDEWLWSLLRFGMGDCGDSGGVVAGRAEGGSDVGSEGGSESGRDGGRESKGTEGGTAMTSSGRCGLGGVRGVDLCSVGGVVLRGVGSVDLGGVGVEALGTLDTFLASSSAFLCLLSFGLRWTRGNSALTSTALSFSGGGVAGTVGGGKSGRLDIDSAEPLKSTFC